MKTIPNVLSALVLGAADCSAVVAVRHFGHYGHSTDLRATPLSAAVWTPGISLIALVGVLRNHNRT